MTNNTRKKRGQHSAAKRKSVSPTDYGKHRKQQGLTGTSFKAVYDSITDGRLKNSVIKDSRGRTRILVELADEEWENNTNATAQRGKAGDKTNIRKLQEEDLRWRTEARKLAYLKQVAALVGSLDVERAVRQKLSQLAPDLHAFPAALKHRLAAEGDPDAIERILIETISNIYKRKMTADDTAS